MNKIELSIVALTNSVSTPSNYAIILQEEPGQRRLPIIIGSFEAQSIAMALERMETTRPLTHDLFRNAMHELKVELKEVVISKLLDGVFHADMVCERSDGRLMEIDARTSDAIALAVRFECPIYTYENIMDAAGIIPDEEGEEEETPKEKKPKRKRKTKLKDYSVDELEKWLSDVLEEEDYEQAARIRDEITRRSS
ncbi:MAG: bifunctional nuclease domain-containing protein [Bacteroidota bacterium]